jgi:glycosyltransferase involved in cell wall biosynthesis
MGASATKVALLFGSPPKKLGSLERWLLAIAEEVRRRGHVLDVFTYLPVHPAVRADLDRLGVGSGSLEAIAAAPVAWTRRLARYDLLHVNLLQPRAAAALIAYAAWPARVIWVDHSSTVATPDTSALRRSLSRALDRVTLARASEVVCVSGFVRSRVERRFRPDPSRIRVIHNGVDLRRFTVEKAPNPSGALRLLCVAQLIPEKGVDVLLRALASVRARCALRIVGFGRMEQALRALAAELGLADRVELLGMRDDVPRLLQHAEVLVHPATWGEAFGFTVTEGMAAGCGVIATRTGGIPEIITDGEDGLLVPPGDAGALAQAIDRLADDPGLCARLAAAARRTVERAFSLSRCVRQHVDCMEEVAAAAAPGEAAQRPARP